MTTSLGLIETIGLPVAITAMDAAVKSANVHVIDYELTRGSGLVTIKLEGDVAAVKAAVHAGAKAAEQIGRVYATLVIPRPSEQVHRFINKNKQVQVDDEDEFEAMQEQEDEQIENEEESAFADDNQEESAYPNGEQEESENERIEDIDVDNETCNLCHDPACPRRKGDLRTSCIHYKNEEE